MKTYNNDVFINEGKVILLFTTDWCGDCIALKNYIEEVVKENPTWNFIKVNSDDFPHLAKEYKVYGIPSFVALEDGKHIGDLISKESKPKSLINSWIKTLGVIEYDK